MNGNVQSLFYQAIQIEKQNHQASYEYFNDIIQVLQPKNRSLEEEKIYAICNMKMFIASKFGEIQYANISIRSFQRYLSIQPEDSEVRFYLVDILELSYQYDKAFQQLLILLNQKETKDEAIERLLSEVYVIEGLLTKEQLENIKRR